MGSHPMCSCHLPYKNCLWAQKSTQYTGHLCSGSRLSLSRAETLCSSPLSEESTRSCLALPWLPVVLWSPATCAQRPPQERFSPKGSGLRGALGPVLACYSHMGCLSTHQPCPGLAKVCGAPIGSSPAPGLWSWQKIPTDSG